MSSAVKRKTCEETVPVFERSVFQRRDNRPASAAAAVDDLTSQFSRSLFVKKPEKKPRKTLRASQIRSTDWRPSPINPDFLESEPADEKASAFSKLAFHKRVQTQPLRPPLSFSGALPTPSAPPLEDLSSIPSTTASSIRSNKKRTREDEVLSLGSNQPQFLSYPVSSSCSSSASRTLSTLPPLPDSVWEDEPSSSSLSAPTTESNPPPFLSYPSSSSSSSSASRTLSTLPTLPDSVWKDEPSSSSLSATTTESNPSQFLSYPSSSSSSSSAPSYRALSTLPPLPDMVWENDSSSSSPRAPSTDSNPFLLLSSADFSSSSSSSRAPSSAFSVTPDPDLVWTEGPSLCSALAGSSSSSGADTTEGAYGFQASATSNTQRAESPWYEDPSEAIEGESDADPAQPGRETPEAPTPISLDTQPGAYDSDAPSQFPSHPRYRLSRTETSSDSDESPIEPSDPDRLRDYL